ncbi:MAG: serine hydrolase [Ruminococcaceae bacterium]|nr:serine hydrolase [Oscillospiraceae bacterium]
MNINTLNRTLVLLKRLFDTSSSTKAIISIPTKKPVATDSRREQSFIRTTPESQGIETDRIVNFVNELKSHRELELQNLLILRNGKILYENSFGPHNFRLWKNTYSQCKSIVSLAIGCLYDQGKISPNTKIVDILGDIVPLGSRLKFKNLTVEHLLTMRSTVLFNEASAMTTTDWVKAFFISGTTGEIGVTFNYNSMNTYLLSYIIKVVSGENLSAFLDKNLFGPMGITDYYWETCPNGIEKGGWGLYIHPEDIAKIGQLVLNKGYWNGKPLISSDWLSMATKIHCSTPDTFGKYDYGYHIWVREDNNSFLFNGMLGQNVMGFKDSGILVVSNMAIAEMFQQSKFYDIACKYFGGTFPEILEDNPFAQGKLYPKAEIIGNFFTSKEKNDKFTDFFKQFQGCFQADNAPAVGLLPAFLQIVQNNYTKGTSAISFEMKEKIPVITYFEEDEQHILPIGINTPVVTDLSFHQEPYQVAVSGNFAENEDGIPVLKISVFFTETPCTRILKFYHYGDFIKMNCIETPGTEFLSRGIRTLSKGMLTKPVIGSTLAKLDYDFLDYKIRKLFEPTIKLQKKE